MASENSSNRRLIETALGSQPADMIIKDGTLFDVYSGRLLPHRSVAIAGERIAYVGPDATHTIGKKTKVIEANGRFISPGYIDGHTHLSKYWNIADFLKYAIPAGTTTYISDVETYCFAFGVEGFKAFLDQTQNRPAKIYSLIPPMMTVSPATKFLSISIEEAKNLLKDKRVLGLGESFWQGTILPEDSHIPHLMQEALKAGKSVEGHAAGASDKKLAAFAAAGALSCHESISTEDVLSRLELGYYVMIREGDIRQDLKIILPVKDDIDWRRLILVTDGTNPELVLERSYLTGIVQKAVQLGIDPIKVVQMVTLNPAEHFGLDHLIGGVSPGRFADILILPELGVMKPDMVISNGCMVAENSRMTVPLKRVPHPKNLLTKLKAHPISNSELKIPLLGSGKKDAVRCIEIQPGGLVTREGRLKPRIIHGQYAPDPENDLLKIVFIERVTGRGEKFVGFIRGWGQKKGSVATTLCWNACGIVAIGAKDEDLTSAINRLIEIQGGIVVSFEGNFLVDIPFSVGGYVTEMSIEDLAESWKHAQEAIAHLGSSLKSPLLTLFTLTTAAIPFIRITEKGYFRFRENDITGL